MTDGILYLSRRDVERACREIDPVAIVASALARHARGETVLPAESYLAWTAGDSEARSLSMPAFVGGVVGTKVINANPANVERGRPRASALTILFDPSSARPVAILEGALISSLRTAAVTALCADLLAVEPVERLALLGAGELAAAHLALLVPRLRALREVRLYDLVPERAAVLARGQRIRVDVLGSAEEAIRGAQLVVAVTTATSGYISLDWLEPGALLVNVSLDDPLPEVVLGVDRVIVDDRRLVEADGRRLLGRMLRDGLVTGPFPELGELVVGAAAGRMRDDEIVLVNPFGLAIEDVAVAGRIYDLAIELGLGLRLER